MFAYREVGKELMARGLINQLKQRYKFTGGEDVQWFLGIELIIILIRTGRIGGFG
jgi:hypothetical protein